MHKFSSTEILITVKHIGKNGNSLYFKRALTEEKKNISSSLSAKLILCERFDVDLEQSFDYTRTIKTISSYRNMRNVV